MMKKRRLLISLIVLAAIGIGVRFYSMLESQRSVLNSSEKFTLYSLEPDAATNGQTFHGNAVLGKTEISDPTTKRELLDSLYAGFAESGDEAACFFPRHGLKAVKGSRVVDVEICFECHQVFFIENDVKRKVLVSSSPQKVFDRVLQSAEVPIGERDH